MDFVMSQSNHHSYATANTYCPELKMYGTVCHVAKCCCLCYHGKGHANKVKFGTKISSQSQVSSI